MKDAIDILNEEIERLRQLLDACEPYLKEGETPAQCIERNRRDAAMMTLKWQERGERMKAMRQWMTEFPAYSHRYATMWDQFAAKKDALPWFKDGEPL